MSTNPALADLQPLVGTWRMELHNAAFLPSPDARASSLETQSRSLRAVARFNALLSCALCGVASGPRLDRRPEAHRGWQRSCPPSRP